MAIVQVRKSDLSGEEIPRGQGVRVRIIYDDTRLDRRADLTVEEAEALLPFAQEVEPRPSRKGEKRMRL
jgi:hypothetical protein